MKFKLEDFKICSINELSKVVGGASDCKTASWATASGGGCDDDWSWDDTTGGAAIQ
jgi:bacteriocin-like protein